MKKLLNSLSLLLFAAMFLLACSNTVVKEEFKDNPEVHTLKGVIVEKSGKSKGTHALDVEKGDDEALRSLLFNLSDEAYLGNEVKISAVYNEEDDVYEVTDIKILKELQKLDEGEAKLIKYRDSNLGIELEYFDSWTAVASDVKVSFFAPEDDDGKIDEFVIEQIIFNYQPPNLQEDGLIEPSDGNDSALLAYVNEAFSGDLFFDQADIQKVGSASQNAIAVAEGDGVSYYFYRPGLIYKLSFVQSSKNDDNEIAFGEMLNSFKFIAFAIEQQDFSDTGISVNGQDVHKGLDNESVELPELDMGFTSFESLPYSFEAQYPDQWYYAGAIGSGSALHHYGFSDKSFEDGEEIISLDIMKGDAPAGAVVNIDGVEIVKLAGGSQLYVELNGYLFKFSGPSSYADIMLVMASSLTSTD